MKSQNLRAFAASLLLEVIQNKKSLSHALLHLHDYPKPQDQGLIQELCFGVMRQYPALATIAQYLLQKPFKEKDEDIHIVILLGLYQLLHTRVPAHAAIKETVDACVIFKKPWATKLVNAVLRNFQRQETHIKTALKDDLVYTTSHPLWLLKRIRQAWPTQWPDIIAANNAHPPMTLRCNPLKMTREAYLQLLNDQQIIAQPLAFAPYALQLEKPLPVDKLPLFNQGVSSVQDESSQIAPHLMDLAPHLRVLDACAAPGGKTAALFEQQPDLAQLVALDQDEIRLSRIRENQQRCGFKAHLIVGDALHPEKWWDQALFDRILVDAPCTATGIIRRHPDIKFLREPTDVKNTVRQQEAILNALWPLLKKGGILVYSTCSILPEENALQLKNFIANHADAKDYPIQAPWGLPVEVGRQILPGEHNMDGFFYGRVRKT